MPVTSLPDPPQRNNPTTFADRGDAFLGALPTFATQIDALETNVNAKEASAVAAAAAAYAAQMASESGGGAAMWVSGTTYAVGDVRWSPTTFLNYRRKVAGAGATDPASDAANWAQLATVPVQTGNSGKVLGTDGVNASWGWATPTIAYDDRANLRALSPTAGASILVDGLGLFVWESGSAELDDDETAFATATGVWLLNAASPEYTMAVLMQGDDDLIEDASAAGTTAGNSAGTTAGNSAGTTAANSAIAAKILRGTFTMSATSLATITSTSFTATVTGAATGDGVVVNPGNSFGTLAADMGKLSYVAYVSAADTVTVTIRNASASTANMTASTWSVYVIKQ